jgi:hypothetical protein
MINKIFTLIFILSIAVSAQPVSSHYYKLLQKDSLYYLLTDKALLKFYSHGTSGEFYLTRYIEGDFTSSTKLMLNDDHFFIGKGDSIFCYSNIGAWDLSFSNLFVPDYSVSSLYDYGPYFIIRSGNAFNLLKIRDDSVLTVEDTLFTYSPQTGLFFTYPFAVLDRLVYKFLEGFGFYEVGQIEGFTTANNTGITHDTLITYVYWLSPDPWPIEYSTLYKRIIEEPSFPAYTFENWGANQLHCAFCTGTLIAKENLYYMVWVNTIVKKNGYLAYSVAASDIPAITDNYIFLLGDSARYSKWYAGSTFYPFTWTDLTDVKEPIMNISSFALSQNYPNPFNPTTIIKYQIPGLSKVRLTVYDMLGREIKTLVDDEKSAGAYEVEFNGIGLPSGVYLYRIEAGKYSDTKKFILIK